MSNLKETVAANIKRFRQHKNINAAELADALGTSQSTISDWETAKKLPRAGAIEKMANYFGVLKSDLLTDMSETQRAGLPPLNEIIDLEALLKSPIRIAYSDKMLTSTEKLLLLKLAKAVFCE